MKKLTLLLLCIATLGLASCQKETIINQELKAKTYNFRINANEWIRNTDGSYSVEKSLPAIDAKTLDDEGILVYFEHPLSPKSHIQLPYTYNYNAFSYEVYDRGIAFDVQDTNDKTLTVPPNYDTLVKVVIIPSDYVN